MFFPKTFNVEHRHRLIDNDPDGYGDANYPAHSNDDPDMWVGADAVEPRPEKARREARLVIVVKFPWLPTTRWRHRR